MDTLILAADINTTGISTWVIGKIVPILLLFIGLGIILAAKKGRVAEGATTIVIVLMGLAVMVSAGLLVAFSKQLGTTVFGG